MRRPYGFLWGVEIGTGTWQQSTYETNNEIFADMFLGWVGNGSNSMWMNDKLGPIRAEHMNSNMPDWIDLAIN